MPKEVNVNVLKAVRLVLGVRRYVNEVLRRSVVSWRAMARA